MNTKDKTVTSKDVISVPLTDEEVQICIDNASRITPFIRDRNDLHPRDYLERFEDVLMGEVAERMVLKWLRENGKTAKSAVDKGSNHPDLGHDIWIKDKNGNTRKCSVKSSLVPWNNTERMLSSRRIASKFKEAVDISIQVMFYLDTEGKPRKSVPCLENSMITAWIGKNDVCKEDFKQGYSQSESREVLDIFLSNARPMDTLLAYLS